MTAEDLQLARERILATLASSRRNKGVPMRTVINDLKHEPGVQEDALRTAVWELIDRGEVKLSSNRELRTP